MAKARAILFVDGSNWYHGLGRAGVQPNQIDFSKLSLKLVGPAREWIGLRYYVGEVKRGGHLEEGQKSFFRHLLASDQRMSLHLGRIESRMAKSEAASELLQYLGQLRTRIDPEVYRDLVELGNRHRKTAVKVEKAVDVMLAVDLVTMAHSGAFDTAYLLSADGDYTHAVGEARRLGKKVFAASASHGTQLGSAVDHFLHLEPAWLEDCLR